MLAEAEAEALAGPLARGTRRLAEVRARYGWPPGVVGTWSRRRLWRWFERPAFALALNGCISRDRLRPAIVASISAASGLRRGRGGVLAIKGGGHADGGRRYAGARPAWGFLRVSRGAARGCAGGDARPAPAPGLAVDAAGRGGHGDAGAGAVDRSGGIARLRQSWNTLFVLLRHRLTEVFSALSRSSGNCECAVAGDGQAIEAIAFRAVGKPLGDEGPTAPKRGFPCTWRERRRSTPTAGGSGRSCGWPI